MADFKAYLARLHHNLNILREREARHGGSAPVELLNQIEDHQAAIALTEQVIRSELAELAWREALKPLLVSLNVFGDFFAPPIPWQYPTRATHFTDRERELEQLLADLQPGRVVTLCGPGGIGKTALAAETVWQLPPNRFPDGIICHSFYNQPQAALALEQIALSFGEEARPTPRDAARRALSGRQTLLLLDGAEDADDLPAVLEVVGSCGVLVTSRKRKDAVDERQDIQPLPTGEAVKLLRAWSKGQAADTGAAEQICELVGWLPLAVRLVGKYLDETGETATEYLAWLQETPLKALDQGQQRVDSVPVLLQESLAQVSETARQVLGVVGLLALAPFGREPVAAALGLAEGQVRQPLGELVSYGLLLRNGERYEVTHALIHTYAHERLVVPAEAVGRLAAYYTELAEVESTKGLAGYVRLDVERGHIMRVLAGCVEHEAWEATWGLARAINDYLDIRGYYTERVTAIEAGLTAAQKLGDREGEVDTLDNLGFVYWSLGQAEQAVEFYQQALAIAREIGDRQGEADTLGDLGVAYDNLGQVEFAIAYHQQALVIAREIGDRRREAIQLSNLGNAYHGLSQMEQAVEFYEQALAIAREIGDQQGEGIALGNLGLIYGGLSQMEQAIVYHQQALAIDRKIGYRQGEADQLGNLGFVYWSLGQVEQAIESYQQALAIDREIGYRQGAASTLSDLGLAYNDQGQVEQAIESYQQALAINREIGYRQGEGIVLGNLGLAYGGLGQVEQAIVYHQQSLTIHRDIGDPQGEADQLGNLGFVYWSLGKVEQAIAHYQQALVISCEIGDRRGEGNHLGNLGLAYGDLGQVQRAIEYFEQALAINREIGHRRNEAIQLRNIGELYKDQGNTPLARQYLEQALAIFEEIKSPNAAESRKLLAELKSNDIK